MRKIDWICQPDGHTCGPTSLKMAMDFIGIPLEIKDIIKIYKNKLKDIGGLPFFRMEKVLMDNGLNYEIVIDKNLDKLQENLKDNLIIFSVLNERNIKHWCLVYEYSNGYFYISDPVAGKYRTKKEDLIRSSEKRNFLYIKLNINNPVKKISEKQSDDIFDIVDKYEMKLNMDSNFLFGKKLNFDYFYKLDNKRNGDDFQLLASNVDKGKFLKIKLVN